MPMASIGNKIKVMIRKAFISSDLLAGSILEFSDMLLALLDFFSNSRIIAQLGTEHKLDFNQVSFVDTKITINIF